MNISSYLILALLAFGLPPSDVLAQDATATATVTITSDTGAKENPGIPDLIGNVTDVANGLSETIAELGPIIEGSMNSRETGIEALDAMLEAAKNVQESLDSESEIWRQLNDLLQTWAKKRDDLSARAAQNPKLAPIADLWQERIDEAKALRTRILDQASASRVLVEQIQSDREVVLAYYDIGAADQVLEVMQKMSDQLGAMNAQMQEIVDKTRAISDSPVTQN